MVEYLLKKPCFVDCRGYPHSTSILLDYVPSYNTFQDVPRVLDPRQIEIMVSQLGKSAESIIEAIPVSQQKTLVALLVS